MYKIILSLFILTTLIVMNAPLVFSYSYGKPPIEAILKYNEVKVSGQRFYVLILVAICKEETQLIFPTGQDMDFKVYSSEKKENILWQWSADKFFTQRLRKETWHRGDIRVYTTVWDGKTNDGIKLPEGNYIICGEVTAKDPLIAQPIQIIHRE